MNLFKSWCLVHGTWHPITMPMVHGTQSRCPWCMAPNHDAHGKRVQSEYGKILNRKKISFGSLLSNETITVPYIVSFTLIVTVVPWKYLNKFQIEKWTAEKVPKLGVFWSVFTLWISLFSPNARKQGRENTPNSRTFSARKLRTPNNTTKYLQ